MGLKTKVDEIWKLKARINRVGFKAKIITE
jgi:hypothetical protein